MAQYSWLLFQVKVNKAYKWKFQKLQLMDLSLSDGSKLNKSDTWRLDVIKREIPILDPADKYIYWLILKFTFIAKIARLTPKRLDKIIIEKSMTA